MLIVLVGLNFEKCVQYSRVIIFIFKAGLYFQNYPNVNLNKMCFNERCSELFTATSVWHNTILDDLQ